jgi:predicted nucleic acid-binding protein
MTRWSFRGGNVPPATTSTPTVSEIVAQFTATAFYISSTVTRKRSCLCPPSIYHPKNDPSRAGYQRASCRASIEKWRVIRNRVTLLKHEFVLVIGNTVLTECDEVLKREATSLGLASAVIDRFLDSLCAGAEYFPTSSFWKPALPDEDDEAFAQLALEAKVGYLVTHNIRHFPADSLPAVQVLTPKAFLSILQSVTP